MVVPEVRAILESRPSLKSVVIFGIEVMRLCPRIHQYLTVGVGAHLCDANRPLSSIDVSPPGTL